MVTRRLKWLQWPIRCGLLALCLLALSAPRDSHFEQSVAQADSAFRQGKPGQAIPLYQTALELHPGDPAILKRLVESALRANRPDMAHVFLRQLTAQQGWSPAQFRYMAEILTMQGDSAQALLYWRASLTDSADDVPTLRRMIPQVAATMDWKNALELATQLLALTPNDEYALYQYALLTLPLQPQMGFKALERAGRDPEYRPAYEAMRATFAAYGSEPPNRLIFQIGVTLMQIKAWPYAERALTNTIELGYRTPAALALLGMVQTQRGRDGSTLIEQALQAAPDDPMVNYAAALAWRANGDLSRALTALARAETADPRNPAIAAEIALSYRLLGRLDYAALWLNIAVSLAPENDSFRTLLANFYAETGYNLSGEGLSAIRNIADSLPRDADARASLGWALFSTGQLELARVEIDRALLMDPTNARAHYYLGILMENKGDLDAARKAYLYVYRDAPRNDFRDLAAVALRRLGFNADLS